jgi:carbon storage regulator
MLVLSRKTQEAIVINGEITVRIIEIRGNTVRLGIEAPKEIPVHRSEIFERTTAQTCAA